MFNTRDNALTRINASESKLVRAIELRRDEAIFLIQKECLRQMRELDEQHDDRRRRIDAERDEAIAALDEN